MQPLSGLLVLDFTTLLPGPLATLMLAEAGAEVVKIERPGGEEMRAFPPRLDGDSALFALLNRGKKSVVLDLKTERVRLDPLLARADVLVEQFRPGVMERLGLGCAALRAKNPRLVYCSVSGYGQAGPRKDEAGHDLNYLATTGLLALQPGPPERPGPPPGQIADIGGGSFPAVINILLALRQRELTGEGCRLDIAMADALFTFAWEAFGRGVATGRFPGAGETLLTGGSPRYQLYPTRDGRFLACGALEEKFWLAFTAAIDLAPALVDDAKDPGATRAAVAAIVASRSAEEWRPVLAAADCCATIVASLAEAVRDPHFAGRGLFAHEVAAPSGATMPALPLPLDPAFRKAPQAVAVAALGADNVLLGD